MSAGICDKLSLRLSNLKIHNRYTQGSTAKTNSARGHRSDRDIGKGRVIFSQTFQWDKQRRKLYCRSLWRRCSWNFNDGSNYLSQQPHLSNQHLPEPRLYFPFSIKHQVKFTPLNDTHMNILHIYCMHQPYESYKVKCCRGWKKTGDSVLETVHATPWCKTWEGDSGLAELWG